ncbi:hypothetical protein F6U93_10235 [Tamlana haliotis]|uniref:Uncharacterized protein n=1 Tax=Pseudotamlana haliotis TaxID=2614804 RepID=A0A6N6MCM2_9FLAO|nr:hypothetical protein [Tamlana haliotis]KAB1067417.1 hypothetical protein F6U93_10235 [Tamlana haliotis]
MKRKLLLFTILSLIFILGCDKGDEELTTNEEPQIELNIAVENTDVKPFEIINVKSTISNLQNTYNGTFGNTELELVKVNDSILVFVVPDIETGTYELKTELGNIEFSVSKTMISNSEETITNVFTAFDNEVNSMDNSPELDETKTFKNEVTELYNSLSTEQKREVAMFYEANKEIFQAFRNDLSTTYDATTTFAKSTKQSNCPKTDFKSFYSCTGDNLGSSINELGVSLKNIAEPIAYAAAIGKLAAATWYLGPAVWGTTAVGASLSIGTAMYILITEVRPAWINFKSNLTPFLEANWILVEATFDVVTDEFNSETETNLNIDAKFRTIEETDNDISSETSFFISAYSKLSSSWNNFSKLLGEIPSFALSEESVAIGTNDIIISNISNSNVELVSQNGTSAKFKSLSGNEENFSFDITLNKEGFTETKTINATVSANKGFEFVGVWHMKHYDDETRTTSETTQISEIDFQNIRENVNISAGYSDYVGLITKRYNAGWSTIEDPYEYGEFWKQSYVANGNYISLTNTYWTNIEYRFYIDENNPNILIGESIGLSNKGLAKEMVKQ